jgi:hypothetical protein
MIVAVVMVLQHIEGCLDEEAVDRSPLMPGGNTQPTGPSATGPDHLEDHGVTPAAPPDLPAHGQQARANELGPARGAARCPRLHLQRVLPHRRRCRPRPRTPPLNRCQHGQEGHHPADPCLDPPAPMSWAPAPGACARCDRSRVNFANVNVLLIQNHCRTPPLFALHRAVLAGQGRQVSASTLRRTRRRASISDQLPPARSR